MTVIDILLGFIIGVVLGSLVKALADRSLTDSSFFGRSECNFCKHRLSFLDLIPVVSFLTLKGKCRYCHKKLTHEYLLVELALGILVGFLFYQYQSISYFLNPQIDYWRSVVVIYDLVFNLFVVVVLSVVVLTDLKKNIIPDRITYPAILITFFSTILITVYKIVWLYFSLTSSPLGKYLLPPFSDYFQRHSFMIAEHLFGAIIMGILVGLFFLVLIIITKGRGMGGGDLKLGIFLGLVFGFPNTLLVLMLAFLLGSVVGVVLLLLKKKHFGQTIPFGPFLTLGGLITLFWGQQIIDWYLMLRVG